MRPDGPDHFNIQKPSAVNTGTFFFFFLFFFFHYKKFIYSQSVHYFPLLQCFISTTVHFPVNMQSFVKTLPMKLSVVPQVKSVASIQFSPLLSVVSYHCLSRLERVSPSYRTSR
jgi:hypothetical protein